MRDIPDVDFEIDFDVHKDIGAPKRKPPQPAVTIPVWNEAKLGPKKTIAEYEIIGQLPQYKAWIKNWYRQRKLAHGHSPESAEKKVKEAFPD